MDTPPSRTLPFLLATGVAILAIAVGGFFAWKHFHRSVAPPQSGDAGVVVTRDPVEVPAVRFTDITKGAAVAFHHTNGSFGKKLLPETMGPGVAIFDYDNDGKPDLLFINSCYWPGHEDRSQSPPTLKLYRNQGKGPDGALKYEDLTATAGLAVTLYGMGVTVGDYDNDGWADVYITAVGGNRLFRNMAGPGGRRFEDVTAKSYTGGPGGWPTRPGDFLTHKDPINWSTSATFLDYDGDGWLDLFVCNYVTWSPEADLVQPATLLGTGRAFVPPRNFAGTQCVLYRNRHDGTFEDVSEAAGVRVVDENLSRPVAKALGVLASDVDGDGHPDIFVANDTVRNFFFHNEPDAKGGRRFREMGRDIGIAYAEGQERGAMGIDLGEYRPGMSALLVGNFANEPDTLLRLDDPKNLQFRDVARVEGVEGPSRPLLKFGAFFFDYDGDGRQDILTCNGHLEPDISKVQMGQTHPQPAQLFWNTGRSKLAFEPVAPTRAGADLFTPLVGRGSAYADLDGDGFLDVVLTANGGPARLLRNEGSSDSHWIRLRLEGDGVRSNRSAIGARVTLEAGGVKQVREVVGARGYLSQGELTVTFGLGKADKVDRITVQWPGKDAGPAQELPETLRTIDRENVVKQGAK